MCVFGCLTSPKSVNAYVGIASALADVKLGKDGYILAGAQLFQPENGTRPADHGIDS